MRKRYTPGFEDMERVLDHLFDEFKKAQRAEWLRQHYAQNKNKLSTKKEESQHESNSQP